MKRGLKPAATNENRMNLKEDMARIVDDHQALSFISDFFSDHPQAQLYLVGGTVRDLLMKRRADVDFDFVARKIATEAIEKWFSTRGTINFVGKTFGVYKFLPSWMNPKSDHFIDIALPRTEQAHAHSQGGYKQFDIESNSNLPIKEDLSRRDFTINAMAINMQTGELIDPFGGVEDIDKHVIRAVDDPNKRFGEDLSRMLRAIRFAAELHFSIEEKTLDAIKIQAKKIMDPIVPRETVGNELAKALARNPSGTIDWLSKADMMDALFSHQPDLKPIQSLSSGQPTLAAVLLLRDLKRDEIIQELSQTGLDSLPRETTLRIEPTDVVWVIDRLNQQFTEGSIAQLRASQFEKYFMNGRTELLLSALRITGNASAADAAEDRSVEIRARWSVEKDEPIPSLLSGNDMLSAGVPAGPQIRHLLEKLRDEQLEGRTLNREQAKQWFTNEWGQVRNLEF
jgi:tRNA nucleotidyltransferase/poly(A) polymerase